MNKPCIQAVFVGQPKTVTDERGTWTSSIFRDPVQGPVQVQRDGLRGDKVTQPYHGGPDAAICVHPLEHYLFWNDRYATQLAPGNVGENFTLAHVADDEVCAGDVVRVGSALLQVSGPRIPCANLARRIGRPDWVKLTVTENRTGFFVRVLESGTVQAGDAWQLEERLNPDGTMTAINRCMYLSFDPSFAQRMTQMQGLGDWWKEQAADRQKHPDTHWTATMKN